MPRFYWVLFAPILSCFVAASEPAGQKIIPSPLFAEPHYHGSCDPEIVRNDRQNEWWIFYTARRATREQGTYVGTPIGVAASKDLRSWRFVGYCSFDGVQGRPDMPVTFWAPGIIRQGNVCHMFVTFKGNANPPWGGPGRIVHYKASMDDLLNGWRKAETQGLLQDDAIDATVIPVDDEFRMYYRVGKGGGIQWAVSKDLTSWQPRGKCPGDLNASAQARGFDYQEAPYVFCWQNRYWMLTDPHKGLAVYVSRDAENWQLQGRILAEPGHRMHDNTVARHPSVAVVDGRALLFYHVEPWRPYPSPGPEQRTVQQKQSFLQAAELKVIEGRLTCDRDAAVIPPEESEVIASAEPQPGRIVAD